MSQILAGRQELEHLKNSTHLGRQMHDHESKARGEGFSLIIGIDEAGRGPLAGPVVAAAVLLRKKNFLNRIADSKKLTPPAREKAFHEIYEKAYVGVGIISEAVVDAVNILEATYLAMSNAVSRLVEKMPAAVKNSKNFPQNVCLLVDGPYFKSDLPYVYKAVIRADESILSVSCASIVAKVVRDRILTTYDQIFPEYGFKQHKGYSTEEHREAIKKHGPSFIHRRSFNWLAANKEKEA